MSVHNLASLATQVHNHERNSYSIWKRVLSTAVNQTPCSKPSPAGVYYNNNNNNKHLQDITCCKEFGLLLLSPTPNMLYKTDYCLLHSLTLCQKFAQKMVPITASVMIAHVSGGKQCDCYQSFEDPSSNTSMRVQGQKEVLMSGSGVICAQATHMLCLELDRSPNSSKQLGLNVFRMQGRQLEPQSRHKQHCE